MGSGCFDSHTYYFDSILQKVSRDDDNDHAAITKALPQSSCCMGAFAVRTGSSRLGRHRNKVSGKAFFDTRSLARL